MRILLLFLFMLMTWAQAESLSVDAPVMPLREALRLLAGYAHINIIVSPDVQGLASIKIDRAEPLPALESLLLTHGLAKSISGKVWYIAPHTVLLKNLTDEAAWQQQSEASAALVTQVWKIRYARATDLVNMLKGDGLAIISERGQLQADSRTNIIFARDTNQRIGVIDRLLKKLDVPVRQVLIEARLVSIDQDAERLLGVDFAVKPNETGTSKLPAINQISESKGRYSIAIAHLPDGSLLDVKLAALEEQGRAELISTPSLFTGSDQEASIEAGEEVPYQEVSESGGTAVAFKKAVLGLKVIPQILPGGNVLLALKINQDRPAARMVQGVPAISTRQIITNVQLKSGQTIVLGGIYETNHEYTQQGVPFLGNIPLIGLLFTQQNRRDQKRELLIFVTPKIMPQAI